MTSIRSATEDDLDAIFAVLVRNGLPLRVEEWRTFWKGNPYREAFRNVPIGSLLETEDGSPVGANFHVHMMYEFDGRPVTAVLGAGAGVDSQFRNKAAALILGMKMKEVDVFIIGSANPAVAKLSDVFARRIPSPGNNVPLLWPLDYEAFASAVLKRKNLPATRALTLPAAAALQIAAYLRGHRGRTGFDVKVSGAFDDSFDGFWERMRKQPPQRLRAIRTRANLEYRFQTELASGNLKVLTLRNGGELGGYLVLARTLRSEFGFSVHEIADLQAPEDEPAVLKALLLESLRVAQAERSGLVKFRAWNAAKRAVAEGLRPYSYAYPLWQAYYTQVNPELAPALAQQHVWDFSPFEIF